MTQRTIPFANLNLQYKKYQEQIDSAIHHVLNSGKFIMGPEVAELEVVLSTFVGRQTHTVACASGTDALMLALLGIDIQPGDEVITSPFTFISTAEVIQLLHAKPVFVDIEPDTFNIDATKIEEKITNKTKAIMPVSLYGQTSDMDMINNIAKDASKKIGQKIFVIEDAAQSFGAEYKGKRSCSLSDLACTSFFPAKPLGCYGDGGAVFTQDELLAKKIKALSTHGQTKRYYHEYVGINGRLDTIQAAVLLTKLSHYEQEIAQRQAVAQRYDELLRDVPNVIKTVVKSDRKSVYAQYTLRMKNRDNIKAFLQDHGIPTAIHYPRPLHLQPCFNSLGYTEGDLPISEQAAMEVLSLPMCAFANSNDQEYTASNLKRYFSSY